MTDHSRAVQAIQALIRKFDPLFPPDAEIEQVLRETMPKPKQYRPTEECRRALAESAEQHTRYWWTGQNGYPSFEERVGYFETALNSYAERMQAEIDHFAKQNLEWAACAEKWKTQAESPLRERLAELVKFWHEKHTTGGIPWGDVADLLKECRNPNHAMTDGSPSPHELGPSCMAESAPPKGDVAAPPQVTRFSEFDDVSHPFHQWWEEHGQFMLSGGGRRESIWAARGWIAREQLACGVEVTGESLHEAPAEPVAPQTGQSIDLRAEQIRAADLEQSAPPPRRFCKVCGTSVLLQYLRCLSCRTDYTLAEFNALEPVVQGEQASPPESPAFENRPISDIEAKNIRVVAKEKQWAWEAGAKAMQEAAAKQIEGNSCVRHCELCRTSPCGKSAAIEIRAIKLAYPAESPAPQKEGQ
jgi:hypothetical protein